MLHSPVVTGASGLPLATVTSLGCWWSCILFALWVLLATTRYRLAYRALAPEEYACVSEHLIHAVGGLEWRSAIWTSWRDRGSTCAGPCAPTSRCSHASPTVLPPLAANLPEPTSGGALCCGLARSNADPHSFSVLHLRGVL